MPSNKNGPDPKGEVELPPLDALLAPLLAKREEAERANAERAQLEHEFGAEPGVHLMVERRAWLRRVLAHLPRDHAQRGPYASKLLHAEDAIRAARRRAGFPDPEEAT